MEPYHVPEETRASIRALFAVTADQARNKVEDLRRWAKNHSPHLPPESQDDHYLNIMLLRSKFRDDYAKKNIENYFRCISKYPEIFEKLGNFKPSEEVGVALATPKLTKTYERVGVLKLCPKNLGPKRFDINQMILVTVTTGLIMYLNDYVASVHFLLDFKGFTMMDLFRVNVRDLFKLVYISENILRIRISGIEILNAPRIMSGLLVIAKMVLKPKMFARVTAHSDLSTIYDHLPKECLPRDYGGDLEPTETLIELWDKIVEKHRPLFQKIASYAKT